ncbi:MAG TPA: hypothetical protein DCZ03_02570 [Gammaproteobacteria bacterium]|nr:hypothetical protein [Gammaproteobacteria bacterium]
MCAAKVTVPLAKIAHARSGDKGDLIDLGLFAYDEVTYQHLVDKITTKAIAKHFDPIITGKVERWCLPNLWALKIVLHGALQGGASRSLRSDNLGKSFGSMLLRMHIEVPNDLPRLKQ